MKKYTVFQEHLQKRTIPWPVISQRLSISRTTTSKWAAGIIYPHKPHADLLIALFSNYGVKLDYNDLYQNILVTQTDLAS